MLLYEALQSALRAVLQHEVVEAPFFDDAMALDDVGVVELPVHLHLLLQKRQVLLLLPDLALVDHLDGEELPGVGREMPEVDLAGVADAQQVLLLVFVLFYLDAALGEGWREALAEVEPQGLGEVQDLRSVQFALPVIFPWKIHPLSIL